MEIIAIIATLIISAIVFIPLGVLIRKRIAESKVEGAEGEAKRILDLAKKEAETLKKEEVFKLLPLCIYNPKCQLFHFHQK